jgi:uncharacterized membrane protein
MRSTQQNIQTDALKPFDQVEGYLKRLAAALKEPGRLAGLAVILNLCITVPLAAVLNIWFDEAYTLNTSGKGIGYAVHQAIYFEEQVPLYFVILNVWRGLSSSIFFARFFSILCISITIYLAALICEKLFKNVHPGLAALAVAFNPFIIWAAVEARLFAFSILISAAALLFFVGGYLDDPPRFTARVLHTITAIVALYTHYFLAFSFAAYGIVLLCLKKQRTFLSYCFSMTIVGASFVPMLLLISQNQAKWSDNTVVNSSHVLPLIESLKTSFAANLLYLLPAEIGEDTPIGWRLLRLLFLILLLAILFFCRRSITSNQLAVWTITLSISTLFFTVFEVFTFLGVNDAVQHYRHTISLLIPALFSVIAVFSLIQSNRARKAALLSWFAFMLVLNIASLYLTYAPLAKNGDYIRVAAYLMKHEVSDQPILIFNPEVEMALSYYYKGKNQLISLPEKEKFQTYDLNAFLLTDQQDILAKFPQNLNPHQTIWLVTDTGSIRNQAAYRHSYQILNEFVSRHYLVQTNQEFYGSNVKLLNPVDSN